MTRRGVLAVALLCVGTPAAAQPSALRKSTLAEDLQMFSQVLHQIRLNHPDSVDTHALIMAAIEGMLQAADPHSYALPATRLTRETMESLRTGKILPVPVSFRFVGGAPVVAAVAPGSRAARVDILRGDELLAIDGRLVRSRSAEELVLELAGPKHTDVTLTLQRQRSDGSMLTVDRTIRRERAEEESPVPASLMLDAITGYVRVSTFASLRVDEDLLAALQRLDAEGMQRLVLDLRDNGGGAVAEAASVAGAFLPAGAVVYMAEQRRPAKLDTVRVTRSLRKPERQLPMVVLVNEGTASASELVAGALQDHDRARVVGRPTFGKSLLMAPFPLTDGSAVMLVMGRIRTPCGRIVQREYRNVSTRDYYRLARAERDTVDRPACSTSGGRRVFGGGGIYPDLLLPDREAPPRWMARLFEEDLPAQWAGGFLTAATTPLPPLDRLLGAPVLPPDALADFRRFVEGKGSTLPGDPEMERRLDRLLLLELVHARDGARGYYPLRARLDPVLENTDAWFSETVRKP